jgi:hypothetical protein
MAIQDFLDGGFYGKLGAMIGQRLGNKRTIRTYVKPSNPNTPAQQEARAKLAKATRLTQEAYNINKGDPAWEFGNTPEFSRRMSTCLRRLYAGATDEQALPLWPDGYNPVIRAHVTSSSIGAGVTYLNLQVDQGDMSNVADCYIVGKGFSSREEGQFDFNEVLQWDQANSRLISSGFIHDIGKALWYAPGIFRSSLGTPIEGAELLPSFPGVQSFLQYDASLVAKYDDSTTPTMAPGNQAVRIPLPANFMPAGQYCGFADVEVYGSSPSELDADPYWPSLTFDPASGNYITVPLSSAITGVYEITASFDLISLTELGKAYGMYVISG